MLDILVINEETKTRIEEVKKFSRNNYMGIDELKQLVMGRGIQAGDRPEHVIYIPMDYRIVYNIEEQPDANLYHHMSITRKSGKVPNPYLVTDLLPLFDMGNDLSEMDNIWVDGKIVNLIKIWKKLEDREVTP